jgi:hypothetical protein
MNLKIVVDGGRNKQSVLRWSKRGPLKTALRRDSVEHSLYVRSLEYLVAVRSVCRVEVANDKDMRVHKDGLLTIDRCGETRSRDIVVVE